MKIKFFSNEMLSDLVVSGQNLPRKRIHYNLHKDYGDPCQRLFNAVGIDSYIPPHKHPLGAGDECLVAIIGLFAILLFDDSGEIVDSKKFGSEVYCAAGNSEGMGVEVPDNTWHTVLALTHSAVLLEVKRGPFDPSQPKQLAPWAPLEGSAQAGEYLQVLKQIIAT